MQASYLLSGGAPLIKKYKSAAGHAPGIILLQAAAGATGVSTSTTTSWVNAVGLAMDGILAAGSPVTYSNTQGDVEYLQSVIVNPDVVLRALMVGSATNAALETRVVGSASSNGLTVVGTAGMTDPSSPDMDEGTVWYISGSNSGASRKITSTTTALTVTVVTPFAANKVGDTYITIPYFPGMSGTSGAIVTMSTNLKNVRAELAITGATAAVLDLELNGASDSYLQLIQMDNVFAGNIT
jgi:hypothetical protein